MLYSYEQCKILLSDTESYDNLQSPLLINWNINGECQNKCTYCFSRDYKSIPDLLSESKLAHIIACIKLLNPLVVVISGGEPLLYPKLKYIIDNLNKYSGVIIDTNGLCLNEDFITYFKENKILLRISLDDYRSSINDKIRKSSINCSTDIILDKMEKLLVTNTNFIVHTVLSNYNIDNILEFGKYLNAKGIKFWEIQVVIPFIGDIEKLHNKISDLKNFEESIESQMTINIHPNSGNEKGIILINPKGEFLIRKTNSLKKEFIDSENKDNPDLSTLMKVLDIKNHFQRYTGKII
ncbi:radical SAM protein [Blautia schinkii]|nr:radical SAM protein [Blautia schinkii]